MSATTTLAPSPAKIRAMLAPMPEAAPVIRATLSASLISVFLLERRPLIDADRGAHDIADAVVDDEIGDGVERCRFAVDDRQRGAVALGQLGKTGGRVNDER